MTSTKSVTARSELELAIGEYAKIAIRDNGQGMPPDVVAHAFELFFTTRERQSVPASVSVRCMALPNNQVALLR